MLALKYRNKSENYTWPGFVDALASLLMVIIFVLMVFVIAQFYISQKLSGKDKAIVEMEDRIIELADLLSIEKKVTAQLSIDLGTLEKRIKEQNFELLENQKKKNKNEHLLNTQKFELNKLKNELNNKNNDIVLLEKKLEEHLLNSKKQEKSFKENEQKYLASKEKINILIISTKKLQNKINQLKNLLSVYQAKDAKENIKNLNIGKNLNSALARRVEELQRFKSDFFGRVKEKLKNRPEIKIVGDRFVFQSEVLFELGSIFIGEKGKTELKRLATILLEIEKTLPKDINWILQIEGHTDNLPVKKGQEFLDNWELSTERALSVLRYLINQGLSPKKLSASGYGSFQPLVNKNNDESRSKNRRIEIKITQKLSSD